MSNIKKIITINRTGIVLLFFIILIGLLLIYSVQGKSHPWESCGIRSNYGDWCVSNIIAIISNGNNKVGTNVNVFVVNKPEQEDCLSEIDPVNLQQLVVFHDLNMLDNIKKGSKMVIRTSLPLDLVENYLSKSDFAEKCAFIIYNEMNDYALIHQYFYTKNCNISDFTRVKVIRINCVTDKLSDIRKLTQYYLSQNNNDQQERVIFYIQGDSLTPNYLFRDK
jgi:hypothetical protein